MSTKDLCSLFSSCSPRLTVCKTHEFVNVICIFCKVGIFGFAKRKKVVVCYTWKDLTRSRNYTDSQLCYCNVKVQSCFLVFALSRWAAFITEKWWFLVTFLRARNVEKQKCLLSFLSLFGDFFEQVFFARFTREQLKQQAKPQNYSVVVQFSLCGPKVSSEFQFKCLGFRVKTLRY